MNRLFTLFRYYSGESVSLSKNILGSPMSVLAVSRKINVDLRYLASTAATPQVAGKNEFKVRFLKDGKTIEAFGKAGDTLLDVVINNDLDFDGFGACEGTLACSSCHVILQQADFDRLPSKPCDEELDMLDLAYDLTKTSRLGCQIELSKDLDGVEVQIPATRNDARSS